MPNNNLKNQGLPESAPALAVGPKRNLIIPIGVAVSIVIFSITVTWWVSEKYHEARETDQTLAGELRKLTESNVKLTQTVDDLRTVIDDTREEHDRRLMRLELKTDG